LLKGALHLVDYEDPEAFSVLEVELEALCALVQDGDEAFDPDGFIHLSAARQSELLLRARQSASDNLPMPIVTLAKHRPICFFEQYSLPDKGLSEAVTELDLLFPHREALYASVLTGQDLIMLFRALSATRIAVQIPTHQIDVAKVLMQAENTTSALKPALNDPGPQLGSETESP